MISRSRALRMPPCLSGAALCQAGPWLCRAFSGFLGFSRVFSGFLGFSRVLSGFIGFYRVLSDFIWLGGFYRALMGFRGLSWVWVGFSASLLVDDGPLEMPERLRLCEEKIHTTRTTAVVAAAA